MTVYDGLELPRVERLKKLAAGVASVDQKSSAAAFELGRFFDQAFDVLPEEKTYGEWVKQECNRTPRSARQYRSIVENLWEFEQKMTELVVAPTVMIHLAEDSVTQDQVESVLAMYERGERVTVSRVKRFLRCEDADGAAAEPVAPEDLGGRGGLARVTRQREREDIALFVAVLGEIGPLISEALAATPVDRQVKKGRLQDGIFKKARLAAALLGSLIFSRMPDPADDARMVERRPLATTGWMRTYRIIERLGDKEAYPPADQLREWLELDVLPALAWAMAKDVQPPMPERQPAEPIELPTRQVEQTESDETEDADGTSTGLKAMLNEALATSCR